MNPIIKIVGNDLVAVLDVCLGALIGALVARYYEFPSPYLAAIIGGMVGIMPDIDLPSQFKKNGTEIDHHRSLFHYPLICIPVGAVTATMIGGLPWAIIVVLCLAAHYLHDMTGPYGGLVAFWPISDDLFGIHGKEEKGYSKRELYIQTTGHAEWIRMYWLRPSILSIPELTVALLCSFVALAIDMRNWWIPTIAVTSSLAAVCL